MVTEREQRLVVVGKRQHSVRFGRRCVVDGWCERFGRGRKRVVVIGRHEGVIKRRYVEFVEWEQFEFVIGPCDDSIGERVVEWCERQCVVEQRSYIVGHERLVVDVERVPSIWRHGLSVDIERVE